MRVGFIGLGMMGKGMAANLQKAGHQLTVHDLNRAAAEPFLAKGAIWANSPRQVAEASEVVFTSLPVPADVEAVALGPNGLIEGMRPDTAFFDMSTNSVAVVRKINAAFAEKNLYMHDSPVSGGPGGANSSSAGTRRCSTRWATRRAISGRSAPARSPSSCTIAPAPSSAWRSPR